jgi:hypothetical protein
MAHAVDKRDVGPSHRISDDDPQTKAALRKLSLDHVRYGEPLRPLVALRRLFTRPS